MLVAFLQGPSHEHTTLTMEGRVREWCVFLRLCGYRVAYTEHADLQKVHAYLPGVARLANKWDAADLLASLEQHLVTSVSTDSQNSIEGVLELLLLAEELNLTRLLAQTVDKMVQFLVR
jgi:hypothetical protein